MRNWVRCLFCGVIYVRYCGIEYQEAGTVRIFTERPLLRELMDHFVRNHGRMA